jgi:hypothetical protein
MPQLRPGWEISLAGAALLVLVALGCALVRRPWARPVGAFAREFVVVMLLLALWQRIGGYVHSRVAGAQRHGTRIYELERAWGIPDELSLQQALLPYPDLVRGANIYYAYAHLNGMAIFLVWLWWRHRSSFPQVRNVVVFSTLACLLTQSIPVAPPRLLPELGFVDTALQFGQSVYGPYGSGIANQLAAMPSVHVSWAAIVGWYVWRNGAAPWRVIGPVHMALTFYCVVVTANHWWLDGFVAIAYVVLAVPPARWFHRGCVRLSVAARRRRGAKATGRGSGPDSCTIPPTGPVLASSGEDVLCGEAPATPSVGAG